MLKAYGVNWVIPFFWKLHWGVNMDAWLVKCLFWYGLMVSL